MQIAVFSAGALSVLLLGCASHAAGDDSGAGGPAAVARPAEIKSISGWVSCDGTSDQALGVARAFAAARHGAFTLSVDCPVKIHVGKDIARAIFIDDGTTVQFTGSGKFIVDNTFVPAFVIANSSDITLAGWNVEYDASLPVSPGSGGYENSGRAVAGVEPGNAFSDLRLTQWLSANRGIVFDRSRGNVASPWTGPTNMCAVFLIMGDSSNVTVTGMLVAVPASAGADRFVPVVFAMNPEFKSNQTVTAATPDTAQYRAVPQGLTFSGITLDGIYMGWVGGTQNSTFDNIQSGRYADLQDANGGTVGGVGKWFAPPHLFYLNYSLTADPALVNKNIQISQVVDKGIRVGIARDLPGTATLSGNALSLKIGCNSCSVDHYTSFRPDGFLDLLKSDNLTISNVVATYNSQFLNNLYPGWRFPEPPYTNVRIENVSLTDTAATTTHPPIDSTYDTSNENLNLSGIQVTMNRWAGAVRQPIPTIAGPNNQTSFAYLEKQSTLRIASSTSGTVGIILQANPSLPAAGQSISLIWSSNQANNCAASGGWAGALAMGGTRAYKVAGAGDYNFSIECRNSNHASSTSLQVVASP